MIKTIKGFYFVISLFCFNESIANDSFFYNKSKNFLEKQEYQKSLEYLLKIKEKPIQINYKLGQLYYALSEYDKAQENFKKSIEKNYKISTSLYYSGLILSKRKQFFNSVKLFSEIIKRNNSPKLLKQSASFEIAESFYTESLLYEKDLRNLLLNYVFPQYLLTYQYDENSLVAELVKNRVKEIKQKHNLFSQKKIIKRKSKSKYKLLISSDINYNSNFNKINSENIQSNKKSSFISRNSITGMMKKKILDSHNDFLINLNGDWELTERSSFKEASQIEGQIKWKSIYLNESSKFLSGFVSEISFIKNKKSLNVLNNFEENRNQYNLSLGQKVINDYGNEYEYKAILAQTISKDSFYNYKTYSFSYEHLSETNFNFLALLNFKLDYNRYDNQNNNFDNYNYLIGIDTIFPNFMKTTVNVNLGLILMLTDPISQRSSRGLEKLFNPEIKIGKEIYKDTNLELYYNFEKRISNEKTYFSYNKHLIGLKINYLFNKKIQ